MPPTSFDVTAANARCPHEILFRTRSQGGVAQYTFDMCNRMFVGPDIEGTPQLNFPHHSKKIREMVLEYTRDYWPVAVEHPLLRSGRIKTHTPFDGVPNLYEYYIAYVADATQQPKPTSVTLADGTTEVTEVLVALFGMILRANGTNLQIVNFFIPEKLERKKDVMTPEVLQARLDDDARRKKEQAGSLARRARNGVRGAVACAGPPLLGRTLTDLHNTDIALQRLVGGNALEKLSLKKTIQKASKRTSRKPPVVLGVPLLHNVERV
tara:strand:+ start:892 stop:1692 length:801 start_codon:yes stop_codon:yes gene_type:complete